MGERGESGARPAGWLAAVIAALVVLVVTGALVERNRQVSLEHRAQHDQALIAQLATGLAADLSGARTSVREAARQAAAGSGPASAASSSLVFVGPDGAILAGTALDGADLASAPVAAALDDARDSDALVVSGALELPGGAAVLVAAPVFPQPAPTVEARRSTIAGWVVQPVDLGARAAEHAGEREGVLVSVGDVAFATPRRPPGRAPAQTLTIQGLPLTIRAGDLDRVPVSATSTVIVLVGCALAAAAAIAARALARRWWAMRAGIQRADAQTALIAQVAPVAQHSLDLGEVLPAVAVRLGDAFDLRGIQVATGARQGQVELFSLGARPATPGPLLLAPPAQLLPGESFTLALQRGGRSVAHLQVTAGRPLDESDLASLAVLGELITGAVINASLYASEQDAVRRLRDLDALKTVFLSTASHELRTPVTAITGFASLLVEGWDRFPDEQRQELVGRIAANGRSLVAVVQDLLDFSLLDRREQPLATEPVDLAELAAAVVDRLGSLFVEHRIEVRSTAAPPAAGERNALERVVTNLLTNAAKYSPAGSTITVASGGDLTRGWVEVSDEGPGVPEDERPRIFTRFYRGSGEAEMRTRGVGIGLSVVAELVQRLGGTVEVGEAPTGGARFRVELPVWVAGDGAEAPDREVEGATTS